MRGLRLHKALLLLVIGTGGRAEADIIFQHQGANDPTTEGFTFGTLRASTVGSIANDLGLPAWRISPTLTSSQAGYWSGPPSASQLAQIEAEGFVVTMTARALQGIAPAYDSTNFITVAAAFYDTGERRYEMDLGIDANGNTVLALPTYIDRTPPPELAIMSPGPHIVLPGNGYHTYQLVFSPTTQNASLYVDGTLRLTGYEGHTRFVENQGLVFSGVSGGQGNFNYVSLANGTAVVPEPSQLVILATAGLSILTWRFVRKLKPHSIHR